MIASNILQPAVLPAVSSVATGLTTALQPAAPLFAIPIADLGELVLLPEKRRAEVQDALELLARVHALRAEGRSLESAARITAATLRAQARGASAVSLVRKHYLYANAGGDWRALVKNYKAPKKTPPEFDAYIKALAEDNHRSMAAAWELLRSEIWPSGRPVPGHGTWRDAWAKKHPARALPAVYPRGFFPDGWHPRTLYRHAPSKGARVIFQRGMLAAKKHFPSVKRDPSQLRPLELIVIDDFELDCLCVFPGDAKHKPQIGRVAGLLAMDVATRRILYWAIGQRLEREERQPDGTVRTIRTGIARIDMQHFLFGIFQKCGLPDYPITILCENKTATITPDMELALFTLLEKRVLVQRTGFIDHKTLANGFAEHGGKPFEKGWIESLFNQLWNILGAMPGYKGSIQRLNAPANLDAKIALTKMLIGQGEKTKELNLTPEQIALYRLPFPSPAAVEQTFAWACALRDARTEHKFIGFDRVTEFLLRDGEAPRPFSDLALVPVEQQTQVKIVERMESPIERWSRLAAAVKFTTIDNSILALLLLTPKKVAYRNHAITFILDGTGHTYVDADGKVFEGAQEGTEFLAYYDASNPEKLAIASLNGSLAGVLTRLGGRRGLVDIRDKEGMKEAGGLAARVRNREVAAVRDRHADQDAQLGLDRAHNNALLAQFRGNAGVPPADEGRPDPRPAVAPFTRAQQIANAVGVIAGREVAQRETASALARADELDAVELFKA